MEIDRVQTSVLAEYHDEWLIHKDAGGKQYWAPHKPLNSQFLPLWILIGQLLFEQQQGLFEVGESSETQTINTEKMEDRFGHLRTDKLLQGLPSRIRNAKKWQLHTEPAHQESITLRTTLAFHLAYYSTHDRHHRPTFEKTGSYANDNFTTIIPGLVALLEETFQRLHDTGVKEALHHARRASSENVSITERQSATLREINATVKAFCRTHRQRWRLTFKTLQVQLSRLHRNAEDMLYYWLVHRRKTFVGVRVQLGHQDSCAALLKRAAGHGQPQGHASRSNSLIHRFPLQPSHQQLSHLQRLREAFFHQIRRRRWFKHSPGLHSLTAYFWNWCYNPVAGWYLDAWLLFEHNQPQACSLPLLQTRLGDTWESLYPLRFSPIAADSGAFSFPGGDVSEKYWATRSLKSLSVPMQTRHDRYTHPWVDSKALGNGVMDGALLGEGLSVLQLFYQGRLFHVPMPEHRGKAIPAFDKSHHPRGEKKSKMPEARRQSCNLNEVLANLLSTLLKNEYADARFLLPSSGRTPPSSPSGQTPPSSD